MKSHKQELLLGAHLPITGGLERSIITAQQIDCTCVQIFTHSNRQWHVSPLSKEEIELFKKTLKESGIITVVTHGSYLINIALPKAHVRKLSIQTVIQELDRCQSLDIPYLILHPGSHLDASREQGISNVIDSLNAVLKAIPGKTMILIENMSGQGSCLGKTFEELASIRSAVTSKNRIGFCLDTCHAFAAGYDFTNPALYKKFWDNITATIGLTHIKTIHVNDSKGKLGSHTDRHANIGDGSIGIEAFKLLMNDSNLFDIPKILETPHNETLKDTINDLTRLKRLLTPANKKLFSC